MEWEKKEAIVTAVQLEKKGIGASSSLKSLLSLVAQCLTKFLHGKHIRGGVKQ